ASPVVCREEDHSLRHSRHRGVGPVGGSGAGDERPARKGPAHHRHRPSSSTRSQLEQVPGVSGQHLRGDRARPSDLTMSAGTNAMGRVEAILLPSLVAGLLLLAWSLAVRWTGTQVFPTPQAVILGIEQLARTGLLLQYLQDSLFRVTAGFLLSLAIGIPLGM